MRLNGFFQDIFSMNIYLNIFFCNWYELAEPELEGLTIPLGMFLALIR
jgi:hypothetical protein